ncbi:MAG TPA: hypothetical protein VND64_34435 [Pirellulales bacterium]|nr:hypothetical protein [Pirellulales bacterium]
MAKKPSADSRRIITAKSVPCADSSSSHAPAAAGAAEKGIEQIQVIGHRPPATATFTLTDLSAEPPEDDQAAWSEVQKNALSVAELLQVREHLRTTGQASA